MRRRQPDCSGDQTIQTHRERSVEYQRQDRYGSCSRDLSDGLSTIIFMLMGDIPVTVPVSIPRRISLLIKSFDFPSSVFARRSCEH